MRTTKCKNTELCNDIDKKYVVNMEWWHLDVPDALNKVSSSHHFSFSTAIEHPLDVRMLGDVEQAR